MFHHNWCKRAVVALKKASQFSHIMYFVGLVVYIIGKSHVITIHCAL